VVLEALAHVEVGLAEGPPRRPGDVGGRDVQEALEAPRLADELEDVLGPLDVDSAAHVAGHREIVDGGEVPRLGQGAAQLPRPMRLDAEALHGDVPGHEVDPVPGVGVGHLQGPDRGPRRVHELLLDQTYEP
jgi:hypothetical protein